MTGPGRGPRRAAGSEGQEEGGNGHLGVRPLTS